MPYTRQDRFAPGEFLLRLSVIQVCWDKGVVQAVIFGLLRRLALKSTYLLRSTLPSVVRRIQAKPKGLWAGPAQPDDSRMPLAARGLSPIGRPTRYSLRPVGAADYNKRRVSIPRATNGKIHGQFFARALLLATPPNLHQSPPRAPHQETGFSPPGKFLRTTPVRSLCKNPLLILGSR